MLIHILTHTPLFVWSILLLLVYLGLAARRTREMGMRRLFIVPLVMLALSLQDVVAKFGAGLFVLAVWAGSAALMVLLVWRWRRNCPRKGATPGTLLIQGSSMPLAVMVTIFVTKYAAAVTLALAPHSSGQVLFQVPVCVLLGAASGYFLGRLALSLSVWNMLRDHSFYSGKQFGKAR